MSRFESSHYKELNQVTSQLAAIMYYKTPEDYGYKSGDVTTYLNQALSDSLVTHVFLNPNKTYTITDTITVPNNKKLFSKNGLAILSMSTINKPMLSIGDGSRVENLELDLPSGNTSDSACGISIRLETTGSGRSFVNNIKFSGNITDKTANGIYVNGSTGSQAFSVFNNLYFSGLSTAIKVNISSSSTNYANSFVFSNTVARNCKKYVYLNGGSGWSMTNALWNQDSTTQSVFDIYGTNNYIQGFFWDVGQYGSTSTLATFYTNATENIINTIGDFTIVDNSTNKLNYVNENLDDLSNYLSDIMSIPQYIASSTDLNTIGYWSRNLPYRGVQDNILAYADKIHTVSSTTTPTSHTLSDLFNPFALDNVKPYWNVSVSDTVEIDITVNTNVTRSGSKRLDFISILFSTSYPQSITLEVYDSATSSWKTLLNTTTNNKRFVYLHGDRMGGLLGYDVSQIKLLLSNPSDGASIGVQQINARLLSNPVGFTFMPRGGGIMYGDMDLNKNKMKNMVLDQAVTSSRPISPIMGQVFYDTTLKKPIWYNGTTWTDSTGTTV